LAAAVPKARSIAGVLRELGLRPGGWTYIVIQQRIEELRLDISHFTGKGWTRGLKDPTPRRYRPLSEILVANSDYLSTNSLRRRLLKEGLKQPVCEICGGTEWNGRPMPLQLDHANGDRTDNRLVNLRIVCPNCHAQTDTWCGKNRGRKARASVPEQVYGTGSNPVVLIGHEGSNPSGGTQLWLF
jgi:hypothetical protein